MNVIVAALAPPDLRSSYTRSGETRDVRGRVFPFDQLKTLGAMQVGNAPAWSCVPGMGRALVKLDEGVREKGSKGIRVTELTRVYTVIERETLKYNRWIAAGRPDPGSPSFVAGAMRVAYIRPPNETNHQWGGAVDLDVYALDFPDVKGDAALSLLWDIAQPLGFRPIIAHPSLGQSECWHFDYLGPLEVVRALFLAHRTDGAAYRDAYGLTAQVGCILAGTFVGERRMERLVQARLLLAGHWCGIPDGVIGAKTNAALKVALKVTTLPTRPTPAQLLGLLDAARVGLDAIEQF